MTFAGLCDTCIHKRTVTTDKGSVFYRCERGLTDPAYPKYPRLPVLRCAGFEPKGGEEPRPGEAGQS